MCHNIEFYILYFLFSFFDSPNSLTCKRRQNLPFNNICDHFCNESLFRNVVFSVFLDPHFLFSSPTAHNKGQQVVAYTRPTTINAHFTTFPALRLQCQLLFSKDSLLLSFWSRDFSTQPPYYYWEGCCWGGLGWGGGGVFGQGYCNVIWYETSPTGTLLFLFNLDLSAVFIVSN